MLMCRDENCTCLQHQILDYLEKGSNVAAKLALEKLESLSELVDDSGLTLLHFSVKHGNAEMTQHLIDKGCKVDAQDYSGVTPLILALKAGDAEITKLLLNNNPDIYLTDSDGTSSVELIFYLNCDKSYLIKKMCYDKVNNDFLKGKLSQLMLNANNSTKLVYVVFGNHKLTKCVLKNYSINFREPKYGRTALHNAIIYSRVENAKILMEHGANVDVLDDNGYSSLRQYVMTNKDADENSELLEKLLKYSTALSAPGEYGFTDIEALVSLGKKNSIKTLFSIGVDINACFKEGRSLLYMLANNYHAEADIMDLLDELGIEFDVNQQTLNGTTALMIAVLYACPQKVEFLLRHGADVNLTTSSGHSALSHVQLWDYDKENKAVKIIDLLLQYGADTRSFYTDRPYLVNRFSLGIKLILAHSAMLSAFGQPSLIDTSRESIESEPRLKDYCDLCTRQLAEMKHYKVHGTVTLFKLLSEGEEKIVKYTRNPEFMSAISSAMENLEQYYVDTLQRRVSRGLNVAKLQKNVASVIERLTGLCADAYHTIVYKIINYLDCQDLKNLCDISISHFL